MPIYREERPGRAPRWKVRIYHRGKAHEWSLEGTKADAEAFEARERVRLEAQGVPGRIAPRFSDFCVGAYAQHAEVHLKARTWSNRQYTIATLAERLGPLRLTEITDERVYQYQRDRIAEKIKPSTINDEVKVLRAILRHARDLKLPAFEMRAKDLPVRGKRRVRAWTMEEVQRLLRAVAEQSPAVFWPVVFLLHTGCRKGEAIAAEWSWVDMHRLVLRIPSNEEWQPKDDEPREVPIEAPLVPYLRAPRLHDRYLFPTRDGDRYAFWPQRAFDRARKAAGLTGGPHVLRHTYASHFLATRPDLWLLARILGHSTAKITETYAHLLPDTVERARGAVAFPVEIVGNAVGDEGQKPRKSLWGVQDSDLRLPPCEKRKQSRKQAKARR